MSLVERKKEAAKRVQSLINAHKGSVTLDMVKKKTRQPEPYSHPSKTSVTEVISTCILHMVHHIVYELQPTCYMSQPHCIVSMPTALDHRLSCQFLLTQAVTGVLCSLHC